MIGWGAADLNSAAFAVEIDYRYRECFKRSPDACRVGALNFLPESSDF
jgi:hypothetical protein